MKNHSRTFGSNKKGPGYRTPSSFRGQVAPNRISKYQISPKGPAFRGGRNKAP
jgi:hypothetical protein